MNTEKVKSDSALTSSIQDWSKENQENLMEKSVTKRYKFDSLSTKQFLAYCMGHLINDLSAACWFNYLLFYLNTVIKIKFGAYAMLSGQVADALATPAVGYWSDQTKTSIGKRVPWYIGGYFVIIVSFLPVWNGNVILEWIGGQGNITIQAIYYTVFPAIFNFGWASVQISHMALVPSLTCCRSRRDKLNSIRNTFQFIAVLIVYLTALSFFSAGIESAVAFQYLSIICVGLGTITSIFFIIQINEPQLTSDCTKFAKQLIKILKDRKKGIVSQYIEKAQNKIQISDSAFAETDNLKSQSQDIDKGQDERLSDIEFSEDEEHNVIKQRTSKGSMAEEVHDWKQWFYQISFYRYGFVYMCVRLYCNVSSTMISFFIAGVLEFTDIDSDEVKVPYQVALIPLSLYIMSVITSAVLSNLYSFFGKKITLTIGTILCLLTSTALLFLNKDNRSLMYVVSPFIGIAQAITLNTGITLISDVIGLKGSSGAFVFGAYSFLDKIATGIALFFCANGDLLKNQETVRWLTAVVPAVSCVCGLLLVVSAETKKSEDEQEVDPKQPRTKSLQDELAI